VEVEWLYGITFLKWGFYQLHRKFNYLVLLLFESVLNWAWSPITGEFFFLGCRARPNKGSPHRRRHHPTVKSPTHIENADTGMMSINCSLWLFNRFPAVTWWAFIAISDLSPALGDYIYTPHCKESGTISFSLKTFTLPLNWLERRSVCRYTIPLYSPELGAEHCNNRTWSTLIAGKIRTNS
jgi:hypothetical protein